MTTSSGRSATTLRPATDAASTQDNRYPKATAYERLIEALEGAGYDVTSTGKNAAAAQCPAHDDERPSLSLTGIEGQVLVFCHAGCSAKNVMESLDLRLADLYDNPRGASYRYEFADGAAERMVTRTPDKQFRQKDAPKGGTILFRLPQVVAAVEAGVPVYVVEGEKDVLALETLGVVATTAPMGATNWRRVDASPLTGADVVVVVDQDAAGEKWAQQVRESLEGRAASLRFCRAATGKDAADHIAAGHGLDELVDVEVEATPADELHRGQLRMAERLVRSASDTLRYVHGVGWHVWDGTRWARDLNGTAVRMAVQVVKDAYGDLPALGRDDQKDLLSDIHKCESASGLEGVLKIAGSLLPLAVSVNQLDTDAYLLNTANGTLDLRTGELCPHDPADLLTKVTGCGYDPDATAPTFTRFLEEVLPDPEVRAFVQRVFGHALEGRVTEHLLPIFTGVGGNGKGTLVDTMKLVLGDYAIHAEPDLLVDRGPTHTTGQADLLGVRLAVCSETDDGRRLAAATVKRLTGGDTIRARRMRQDNIEFVPSHSVLMMTNHKPQVSADDPAMWRRLRVVPFDVVVANPDGRLGQRLALELPGILAWAVQGYADWHKHGLAEPSAVLNATESYKNESDDLGRFLSEACTTSARATVKARELFTAWQNWCADNGEHAGTEKSFAEAMASRGFDKKARVGVKVYLGLGLLGTNTGQEFQ